MSFSRSRPMYFKSCALGWNTLANKSSRPASCLNMFLTCCGLMFSFSRSPMSIVSPAAMRFCMSATFARILPYSAAIAADAAAARASAWYFLIITGANLPNTISASDCFFNVMFAALQTSSKFDMLRFIVSRSPSAFWYSCCNIVNAEICFPTSSLVFSSCSDISCNASDLMRSDCVTSSFAFAQMYKPAQSAAIAAAHATYGFARTARLFAICAVVAASVATV